MATVSRKRSGNGENGFTLIEIIATLVLSSFLAVLFVQIAENSTSRSYRAVKDTADEFRLRQAMEQLTADFRDLTDTDPTPLVTLQHRITLGAYWQDTANIRADSACFNFAPVQTEDHGWIESDVRHACGLQDTNLKVTLSLESRSLTAVFSQ